MKTLRKVLHGILAFWRGWRWFRVLFLASLAILAGYLVIGSIPTRGTLWSVGTLDRVVIFTLGSAFLLVIFIGILRFWSSPGISVEDIRKGIISGGAVLLLVLTLYATYGAFRNQARLTAESSLNGDAMQLYQLEIDHRELRCLYYNYGHANPDRCLEHIVSSEERFSLAFLYVEEVWSVLRRAGEDEREWGSTYSRSIDFWRDDVSLDPTGLFAYYAVATEGPERAAAFMGSAEVRIADLCANYRKVRAALARHSAAPLEPDRCPRPPSN